MNAAFLLMSSAALAGADPAPLPPHPVPVVIGAGAGCGTCAPVASSDCGGCKPRLLDRLKCRFSRPSRDCGCAPAPCAPAPCPPAPCPPTACPAPCAPAACNPCPTSIAERPNLLDKLRCHWAGKRKSSCCEPCPPACDPCAGAPVGGQPVPPPPAGGTIPPAIPPKEMPKPKVGSTSIIPSPMPPRVATPLVTGAGWLRPAGQY